jgi:hypothetical protein
LAFQHTGWPNCRQPAKPEIHALKNIDCNFTPRRQQLRYECILVNTFQQEDENISRRLMLFLRTTPPILTIRYILADDHFFVVTFIVIIVVVRQYGTGSATIGRWLTRYVKSLISGAILGGCHRIGSTRGGIVGQLGTRYSRRSICTSTDMLLNNPVPQKTPISPRKNKNYQTESQRY